MSKPFNIVVKLDVYQIAANFDISESTARTILSRSEFARFERSGYLCKGRRSHRVYIYNSEFISLFRKEVARRKHGIRAGSLDC